jgi:hypothetical protein
MAVNMKKETSPRNATLFRTHNSYSVEEVLTAGGATAFGRKMSKSNESIVAALKDLPPIERFSDAEWDALMEQLKADK